MPYAYDTSFMAYTAEISRYSARRIVSILQPALAPLSVLDVGCATGTWLKAWGDAGVADVHGVDGDYVPLRQLQIPAESFTAADLAAPIDLKRRFDLVQSFEVGEHIPEAAALTFVENIVRHASGLVLFSAAPPGQGGENHINERPYAFWRALFSQHGYEPYDYLRGVIAEDAKIAFWYRYNAVLYATREAAARLPTVIRSSRVPPERPIPDVAPLGFRLRKHVLRRLPRPVVDALSQLQARIHARGSEPA